MVTISCHVIASQITSYAIKPPISYHTISYHTISYHIISHHIISYHIISYHIISYHIISYHIISYHIISYRHTISGHVMSYDFVLSQHTISHHTTVGIPGSQSYKTIYQEQSASKGSWRRCCCRTGHLLLHMFPESISKASPLGFLHNGGYVCQRTLGLSLPSNPCSAGTVEDG